MNSRDFELIALGHVLTRYRLTGELPNINGQPFNLDLFKQKLSDSDDGPDININIETVNTESDVTIIDNDTVECQDEHHHNDPASETPPASDQEPTTSESPENSTPDTNQNNNNNSLSPSGRLFQYFNRDR